MRRWFVIALIVIGLASCPAHVALLVAETRGEPGMVQAHDPVPHVVCWLRPSYGWAGCGVSWSWHW